MSYKDNNPPNPENNEEINAEDYIPPADAQVTDVVPVERWIYWPPFDSADYLDAPDRYTIPEEEAGGGAPSELEDTGEDGEPREGGMVEQEIRDAGMSIDLPYEAPMPVALKYKDTGQQAWTSPPGWRQGLPPLGTDQESESSGSSGEEPGPGG